MEKTILICNAILWIVTFIYWLKKKGIYNVGLFIILLYTLISCASYHLYISPETNSFYEPTIYIMPFMYLYVIIQALISPLLKIEYGEIHEIRLPSIKIIKPICYYIIISSLYQLLMGWEDVKHGFFLIMLDNSNAIDLYIDSTDANMTQKAFSGTFNFMGVIASTGVNFSMLFFFLYLLYPNKNKKILIGMIVAILITPLMSVASGSREKVITSFLMFVLMYLFLKPLLNKQLRKNIENAAMLLFAFLFIFFVIISLARARGDIEKTITGFESYFGMSFLVFDQKCFYTDGTREGNLVSPLINVVLGGQTYSQEDLRAKYAFLGVDNGVFYTFIGDFVLDYGPYIAFVFLILFSLYCQRINKFKIWNGGQIVLGFILLKLLSGFYLHQFSGIGGNLFLVELFILYYILSSNLPNFKSVIKNIDERT